MNDKRTKRTKPTEPLVDPIATDNLVGFFAQLLETDRRLNPHIYAAPKAVESL